MEPTNVSFWCRICSALRVTAVGVSRLLAMISFYGDCGVSRRCGLGLELGDPLPLLSHPCLDVVVVARRARRRRSATGAYGSDLLGRVARSCFCCCQLPF